MKIVRIALCGLMAAAGLQQVAAADWMKEGRLAPDHLQRLQAADPALADDAARKCAKCHGEGGVSDDPEMPHLVGQNPRYTYKQLMDFANDRRDGGRMNKMARRLSVDEIASLAVRLAALSLPATAGVEVPSAPALVEQGDAGRGIDACADCHGAKGEGGSGDYESPALRGMPYDYFVMTMEAFADGSRHNDPDGVMGKAAKALTDEEIGALAAYYLALGQRQRMPPL